MYRKFSVFGSALLAVFVMVGMANAQLTLVPNGDFSTIDGDSWNFAASGGTAVTFETTGGNGGGYGQIDATAGTWGGVLVAEGGTGPAPAGNDGILLSALGLIAGNSYDFQWDQIDLLPGGNGAIAGIKIESWSAATGLISDSMDQLTATTATWDTRTFNYTIDPTADAIKVVMVQNQGFNGIGGAITGFDNIGVIVPTVIPEPGSFGLVALGMVGLIARRRRS